MIITGIIPARYASSRFPGKPLVDIKGKSMIRRVYEQAKKATLLSDVIIATDDQRIYDEVNSFGGKVVMTSPIHVNGTERCAEVAAACNADVIINIQGDEPFIEPEQIDALGRCFENAETQIATLIKEHPLNEELQNPARIKVVVDKSLRALYFSRNVIPHQRAQPQVHVGGFGHTHNPQTSPSTSAVYYKHIGLYAYRKEVLLELVKLAPTPLEMAESLEQLRWLENGYRIQCALTTHESISIDTPEDLALFIKH
ncbi:MAG: 3-deoxy-manno-octulosonate cytidylyltransferase [Chitinophagales bacterium]